MATPMSGPFNVMITEYNEAEGAHTKAAAKPEIKP